MSERTEKKLQEVAIARYAYRHEAEFAAGFLTDAGVPHRLQMDDPGIGLSIGTMATIWVRGMDVPRAREILEVGGGPVSLTRRTSGNPPATRRTAGRAVPSRPGAPAPLGGRERAISILVAAGGLGAAGLFLTDATPPILRVGVAIVSAGFVLVGVTGRAPRPLSRLLHALAGNAP